MTTEMIYSWQISHWQRTWQSHLHNRLPHALLLSGGVGVGKTLFARALASALLCVSPTSEGNCCGQCRHCHLLNANSHPDLVIIEPEESGKMIKIDQIRELIESVNETAQQGGYRIVIINPANAMNVNAANSLLKSLEEPSARCLFILITQQSLRLLPTIRSRCQEIKFAKPYNEVDTSLEDSVYVNLRQDFFIALDALFQYKEDPLKCAVLFLASDILLLLKLMQSWLRDLLIMKLSQGEDMLLNKDFREIFINISQHIPLKKLLNFIDYIERLYPKISGSPNLNRQLVLEELFIQWVRVK